MVSLTIDIAGVPLMRIYQKYLNYEQKHNLGLKIPINIVRING